MKFQPTFRVCLIFYTYDSANFKSIGNNTHEKNATRYCAGPAYYRMYQQTFTVQNKPAVALGHHHPSFSASGIKPEEIVDAAKICGGAENVVKTETQQTFVNGLARFITLGIYTCRKRVYCSQ